jgi:hypothetical protein
VQDVERLGLLPQPEDEVHRPRDHDLPSRAAGGRTMAGSCGTRKGETPMSDEQPSMAEGLELNESEQGVVIFDPGTDRVHHLNNTAAIVLELCDGHRSAEEIAALLGSAFAMAEPPIIETRRCLGQLRQEGLVD